MEKQFIEGSTDCDQASDWILQFYNGKLTKDITDSNGRVFPKGMQIAVTTFDIENGTVEFIDENHNRIATFNVQLSLIPA